MTRSLRGKAGLGLIALTLLLSACGHYKTDFNCKGFPESGSCLPTSEVYKRRHEQLTKMKPEGNEAQTSPSGGGPGAAADRVAAVAGQAEVHLGQPNITAPKVMKVWIAPWRDSSNFLHEASVVYAIVQQSDWTYGRAPKGVSRGSRGPSIFAPRMTPGLVEGPGASQRALNGGQPILATPPPPVTAAPARPPMPAQQVPTGHAAGVPTQLNGSQDPSVILRQLQQQVPSMAGSTGTSGGVPPSDSEQSIEEIQDRIQGQRDQMYQ